MNFDKEYDDFIKSFVNEHYDLLLTQREYRNKEKISPLNYTPEYGEVADSNYIGNSKLFEAFLDNFVSRFIALEGVVFDIKGHFDNIDGRPIIDVMEDNSDRRSAKNYNRASRVAFARNFRHTLIFDIFAAFMNRQRNLEIPINYRRWLRDEENTLMIADGITCPCCDTYLSLVMDYTSNKVIVEDFVPSCKLKKNVTSISVTLKVPSKKLVFLNSPKRFFKHERPDPYMPSINSLLGCIEETKFFASHNIGYFFVGNTSVYVMQKGDKITTLLYDEYDEKQLKKYKSHSNRGSISCDLWWYTVLDYDIYMDLCNEHDIDPSTIKHRVVPIKGDKISVRHGLAAFKKGHHDGVYSQITVQKSKK